MAYDEKILPEGTVLVVFYATWCPHCRRMMPVVEQIKELLGGQVAVTQLDIEQNRELAGELGTHSIPTFIVYKDGKEMWRQTGEIGGDVLLGKIQQFI